ncbi:MAG: hypothetical protein ABIE55_03890 [Candidatus Aenigmatarchaeota archaeon]
MTTTIKNLRENKNICVVGGYFRIKGTVEIYDSGKYFDVCSEILRGQDETLEMRNAIIITVKEVFDLENNKKII